MQPVSVVSDPQPLVPSLSSLCQWCGCIPNKDIDGLIPNKDIDGLIPVSMDIPQQPVIHKYIL